PRWNRALPARGRPALCRCSGPPAACVRSADRSRLDPGSGHRPARGRRPPCIVCNATRTSRGRRRILQGLSRPPDCTGGAGPGPWDSRGARRRGSLRIVVFETAPNHFLQSFANGSLTWLLSAVTLTGYFPVYLFVLAVIMFGVDLRRGVLLSQLVLWTLAITDLLKTVVALPRPVDVDSTLRRLDTGAHNTAAFAGAGAHSFFALPAQQAIEFYRGVKDYSFGFPSGHVSSATTFWGGAALLFRRRWLVFLALGVIILMPISRMYLGRHFLADIIGGGFIGVAVLAAGL